MSVYRPTKFQVSKLTHTHTPQNEPLKGPPGLGLKQTKNRESSFDFLLY